MLVLSFRIVCSHNLFSHSFLICSLPQFFVGDLVLPSDSEYFSSASIDKGLDHLLVLPCCSPSLTAIQQNCFHVGIETIGFVFTLNMGLINKVDMVCLSPVGYGV